jgi:hypothetical protein
MQAELRMKRIQLNPMRGSFKDHDIFARLVCWSLKRYRLETWLATTDDLKDVNAFTDDPKALLAKYETSYEVYCLSLEHSSNGKTRVAALFLKVMSSYERFHTSMRLGDPLILEKENVEWIPRWKAAGKPRYYEASMRKIETLYRLVERPILEIIRRNRFIRLSKGRRMITFDELCELMNLWTKDLAATPFLDTVVKYSEHLSLLRRCGFEAFGRNMLKSSTPPTREKEYKVLKTWFHRCGIFNNDPYEMNTNAFWEHVSFDKKKSTMEKERRKEEIPLTAHEAELERIFFDLKEQVAVPVEDPEVENGEEELIERTNLDNDGGAGVHRPESEEERVVALKKLTTVKKYAFNKLAMKDMREYGVGLMGDNIVEERQIVRERERRKEDQIYEAVNHFKNQAMKRQEILQAVTNETEEEDDDDDCVDSWEQEYLNIMN